MKRCPECRRDYYDDTLRYCLDDGNALLEGPASGGSQSDEPITVMPFVNESGNADVEYLSVGMTETLIKSLSQVPNLAVKSRSTVFYYKGKEISPKNICGVG